MKRLFLLVILLVCAYSYSFAQELESKSDSTNYSSNYLDIESVIPYAPRLKMTIRGYRWLLHKPRKSISPIPDKYVGWWVYIDKNIGRFTTRHSIRHFMQITKEGQVKVYLESDLWSNEINPALWIINDPDFVMSGILRIHQGKLYIASDLCYEWWERRGRMEEIDNAFAVFDIISASKRKLHLRPELEVFQQEGSFRWDRKKRGYWISKFKKIESPYDVFPNVPIGEFPDEAIVRSPGFWENLSSIILLDNAELSEHQNTVIDSLDISISHYTISNSNSEIDLDELLRVLSHIHGAEKDGKKVLILCSSEYHRLSQFIGACYHYQKTGNSLKEWLGDDKIAKICKSRKLPSENEFKRILKEHYNNFTR